jgi:CRISPR-associated protein Cpf1
MLEYNAVVVLESLNKKFTTSRSAAFGPAVYAQFQNALLNKLSYLVLKDRNPMEEGGILNGYQFAFVPEDGIGDNPKQFGRVFFVPAGYTSKIDPVTGFTSLFDFSEYESSNKKAEKFTDSFDSIRINEDNVAELKFDYSKFKTYVKWPEHEWTCVINGTRISNKKNPDSGYWEYETVDVREKLNNLFSGYSKILTPGTDIKALMIDIRKEDANIDKEFIEFMKVVMHMRNSNPETGEDYIISPAVDKNGQTFDSRDERNCKSGLPVNGDSNGARNIALKGLMTLENEKTTGEFKSITNEEWFCGIQKFSETKK